MIRRETHGLAVDVWSFGICTLELANNNIPNRYTNNVWTHLLKFFFSGDSHNSIYAMFTNTVKGFPKPFVHSSNFSTLFHEFIQVSKKQKKKIESVVLTTMC
jgi:hypothetical protein